MAELDDIIHQPLRLKIMAALNALPASVGLEFSRLKKLTGATDGAISVAACGHNPESQIWGLPNDISVRD